MADNFINCLSGEVIVLILKKLSLTDIVHFSEAFSKWEELIAQIFFQHRLIKLARFNVHVKYELNTYGWTEQCEDSHMIVALFQKFRSKFSGNN